MWLANTGTSSRGGMRLAERQEQHLARKRSRQSSQDFGWTIQLMLGREYEQQNYYDDDCYWGFAFIVMKHLLSYYKYYGEQQDNELINIQETCFFTQFVRLQFFKIKHYSKNK